MRFLPVFLDTAAGPVVLVGGGDMARAKLRLLLGAGAQVRWYATDGDRDLAGVAEADRARVSFMDGDAHDADLSGADLTGADLSGSRLTRVNFDGAKLDGVNFKGALMPDGTEHP